MVPWCDKCLDANSDHGEVWSASSVPMYHVYIKEYISQHQSANYFFFKKTPYINQVLF